MNLVGNSNMFLINFIFLNIKIQKILPLIFFQNTPTSNEILALKLNQAFLIASSHSTNHCIQCRLFYFIYIYIIFLFFLLDIIFA